MPHTIFTTTRGLDRDLPPMRLYEKAKKLGMAQFSKRFERLEKAQRQSLDEIQRIKKQIIEVEGA